MATRLPAHTTYQQSRGIGTRIIEDLPREASEAGLTMTLSAEKDNPRAQAALSEARLHPDRETDTESVMRGPAPAQIESEN
jgi:hypothetical protein